MNLAILLPALIAGALFPVQSLINAQLARHVGHPITATMISVSVTATATFAFFLAYRPALPGAERLAAMPWHLWITGGLVGGYVLFITLFLAPRLGAAALMASVIGGQLIASVLIDHQGWLGVAQREISPGRIAGILFLIVGVVLIRRF